MLSWLYQQEVAGAPPVDWSDFLASADNHYFGSRFADSEVAPAISDLAERNLVTGMSADQLGPAAVKPRLTAEGRDCVIEYGGDVSEYLNRHGASHGTNVTMNHVTGNTVIGNENIVNNQASGIDVAKLVDFADFVRQVLPTLGLPEDERAELGRQADELSEVTTANESDRGRWRRLIDAVMAGVTKAAPGVVTSTAIAMGNEAVKAISGG
ncbi:hypothetical protein [Amycolatopsis sp. NPDC051061]|uniref:hypothetical protein n=1 Tax=Amycolatopsis sp. NPDC051061 TaxID=3155042 RepID=UPI00341769E1